MNEEHQSKEIKNPKKIPLEEMIRIGSQKLAELVGLKLVAVVEVNSQEESGWLMKLEFVEREGIPNTMDLIGLYEAVFDQYGQLLSYTRSDMRKRGDSYN
jgi:Gas vesicle synthesis protein GvpO